MPTPTKANQRVQFGVMAEEFSESLVTIANGNSAANDARYKTLIESASTTITQLATTLKKNPDFDLVVEDRKELLDGLCDVIVTAIGVGYTQGFDIIGALSEVSASNDSKFVDGVALFDENGKIKKGPNFFRPNLDPFLGVDPTIGADLTK